RDPRPERDAAPLDAALRGRLGELRPEPLSRAHSGSASIGPPARMSDSFTFSALNFSAARVSFSTVASNSSGAAPGLIFTKRRQLIRATTKALRYGLVIPRDFRRS